MSATNRGAPRKGNDAYYTPLDCAQAIVKRLGETYCARPPRYILEPSVGKGAFVLAAIGHWPGAIIKALDVQRVVPDAMPYEFVQTSFEEYAANARGGCYDLVIGNPSFALAEAHIRLALGQLAPGGVLAFLLRLNLLGGKARSAGFWAEHPPSEVMVLDRRPSFGKSDKGNLVDSTEYGVFVWADNGVREAPRLSWLRW